MNQSDIKLFIPIVEQKQQKPLYTANPTMAYKKPVALFSKNILLKELGKTISKDDIYTLYSLFDEADKEDLYGNLFNLEEEMPDFILNDNEQKTFLELLKEKLPKLYKPVNNFIKRLQSKSDEEKIAENCYLKIKDWNMLNGNEQLSAYNLSDLNNENLMAISKEYEGTSLLYMLYLDIKEKVDMADLIKDEMKSLEEYLNFRFDNSEERPEEKIKEYIQDYENDKKEIAVQKEKAKKDLETIKEKSINYANYLIQLAQKENIYTKDYEKELLKAIEKNDIKNLVIFTQRLSDRIFISKDKEEKTTNASKRAIELKEPNGQIDETFIQGYTGDCWFLSSLKSMCSNKDVLEKLNKMITVNKEKDVIKSVTVRIQHSEYTIDYDNLKAANEYSTGDLDVRALEIAMNRFMHEYNLGNGDISLGWEEKDAYKFIFGEDNVEVFEYTVDGDAFKFDSERYLNTLKENPNKNVISSLGIYAYNDMYDKEDKLFAEDKNGNQVELKFQHAYNCNRIDNEYLYFTDPHAPENELKVPQEKVGQIFDTACTVKFKENKIEQANN